MKRVNILLREEDLIYLKLKAIKEKKRGISVIIRDLVDTDKLPEKMNKKDPIFGIIGIGQGDGKAVSENYEEYLYGKDNKK